MHAQWGSSARLAWTLVTAVPALLCAGAPVVTLPLFVLEHISIGGGSTSPLVRMTNGGQRGLGKLCTLMHRGLVFRLPELSPYVEWPKDFSMMSAGACPAGPLGAVVIGSVDIAWKNSGAARREL